MGFTIFFYPPIIISLHFFLVQCILSFHSCSLLRSIPLCGWATVDPSVLLRMAIPVVSGSLAARNQIGKSPMLVLKVGSSPWTCISCTYTVHVASSPAHSRVFLVLSLTVQEPGEQTPTVPGWKAGVCFFQEVNSSFLTHWLLILWFL